MTSPTTPLRCEPPPELRDVDGWHWVQFADGRVVAIEWHPKTNSWGQGSSFTPSGNASQYRWRYIAPVATPAEVEALRAAVMRAGSECADMGNEIVRLRAEIASLRVTLGQQPPTEGAEPVGCPLPGMCVMVHDNATIRARVEALEAALRGMLEWVDQNPKTHPFDAWNNARAALEGNHGAPGHD